MEENYGFDRFLLEKWGTADAWQSEKERRAACRKFHKPEADEIKDRKSVV